MAAQGIDVGAWGVKVDDGERRFALAHHGDLEGVVLGAVRAGVTVAAFTGAGGRGLAETVGAPFVEVPVALVSCPDRPEVARHILDLGAGSSTWIDLDDSGTVQHVATSTLCAAGTGGFLDKQAERLGLDGRQRQEPTGVVDPPRIAARCAVFARSDLIHHQQLGRSPIELWSGLCRGMVENAVHALLAGRAPRGPVWVTGGVARNVEVVRWLGVALGVPVLVADAPELVAASGARVRAGPVERGWDVLGVGRRKDLPRWPALVLERSSVAETPAPVVRDGAEIHRHRPLTSRGVFLGIDVGSTSTKAAVLDEEGELVLDVYRRTGGDPLGACAALVRTLAGELPHLEVLGLGTTGSGRRLAAGVLGADVVLNEISAHVRGIVRSLPEVTTIFEIGGQDAKFVRVARGVPVDANMNYLCAAGTGAFIEEQASKLGFHLDEIGPSVLGVAPPKVSDRCTVFMERQVDELLRRGYDRAEVMGSVLYAIAENYLHRVVEKRRIDAEHLVFLGATARNAGLVAAFEHLLGVTVHTTPHAHVTGALGVALEARARTSGPSSFRGIAAATSTASLRYEQCALCTNHCTLTEATLGDGGHATWGFLCGRGPDERRARRVPGYRGFEVRAQRFGKSEPGQRPEAAARTVGLPRALLTWTHLPFWRAFFAGLGCRVVLSEPHPTHPPAVGSDFCFPVRVADAHVRGLTEDPRVEVVFLPHLVLADRHDDGGARSVFCPFHIAFPSIAGGPDGLAPIRPVLTPVVDLQWSAEEAGTRLAPAMGSVLPGVAADYARAWTRALAALERFESDLVEAGQEVLAEAADAGRPVVVVLGRSYLLHDTHANLDLPRKLAALGVTVVPLDLLPLDDVPTDLRFPNVYWRHGRRILQAASYVASKPGWGALYLSAHGCGPDAFLRTFVETILAERPLLQLELDAHGADAGYQTRIEVFREILGGPEWVAPPPPASPAREASATRLWIPPMHPFGTELAAAAFRGAGVPAVAMEPETREAVELGRLACRGAECIPAHATIGGFLQVLARSADPGAEALFLPSAKGPCRFGQYHALHRQVLDRAGFPDAAIATWDPGEGPFPRTGRSGRAFFDAVVAGDLLSALRNRWRPYADPRAFDAWLEDARSQLAEAFERGSAIGPRLAACVAALERVTTSDDRPLRSAPRTRPLVAIIGEVYLRFNAFTSAHVLERIEELGGEAWVEPLAGWFEYLAWLDQQRAARGHPTWTQRGSVALRRKYMAWRSHRLAARTGAWLADRPEPSVEEVLARGQRGFPLEMEGEPMTTVGAAFWARDHGARLIVNCAPFGCMSGRLTQDVFRRLRQELGVPVVTLFFDGEHDPTGALATHLTLLRT